MVKDGMEKGMINMENLILKSKMEKENGKNIFIMVN